LFTSVKFALRLLLAAVLEDQSEKFPDPKLPAIIVSDDLGVWVIIWAGAGSDKRTGLPSSSLLVNIVSMEKMIKPCTNFMFISPR
jgi:hypothetical protein